MAIGFVDVAEGAAGERVALDVVDAALFHLPLVLGRARATRRDQKAVVLGEVAVGALHLGIVERGVYDRGSKIVEHDAPRDAEEELERRMVHAQPRRDALVEHELGVLMPTERQRHHERPGAPQPAARRIDGISLDDAGAALEPEIFPRPDGEVYVCGMADPTPLPDTPEEVGVDDAACATLAHAAGRVSSVLTGAPILRRQACYRPVTDDGLPLIGPIPDVAGAYVATGHGPWGMLNAPATGLALAERIVDGAASALDLAPFDPARRRPARRS